MVVHPGSRPRTLTAEERQKQACPALGQASASAVVRLSSMLHAHESCRTAPGGSEAALRTSLPLTVTGGLKDEHISRANQHCFAQARRLRQPLAQHQRPLLGRRQHLLLVPAAPLPLALAAASVMAQSRAPPLGCLIQSPQQADAVQDGSPLALCRRFWSGGIHTCLWQHASQLWRLQLRQRARIWPGAGAPPLEPAEHAPFLA